MQNTKGSVTLDGASEGLLNKWELAAKLRIGKRTVDLWMHQKRLPFIRIGRTIRFRWSEVLEKLNAHRVN
jgi:excisionase family DNA binding protein